MSWGLTISHLVICGTMREPRGISAMKTKIHISQKITQNTTKLQLKQLVETKLNKWEEELRWELLMLHMILMETIKFHLLTILENQHNHISPESKHVSTEDKNKIGNTISMTFQQDSIMDSINLILSKKIIELELYISMVKFRMFLRK